MSFKIALTGSRYQTVSPLEHLTSLTALAADALFVRPSRLLIA